VKEDIRLIILEHLRNQLNIHVLDIYLLFKNQPKNRLQIVFELDLETFVQEHDSFIELLLMSC
jgi:hypothetical protein